MLAIVKSNKILLSQLTFILQINKQFTLYTNFIKILLI
jgi:hypothetical protein